jgi:mRNA interferase HigB
MNIISRSAIRAAQLSNPRCRKWLDEWWRNAKREQWTSLHDVRQTYASADQVGNYLVFDAPEAKRLIVGVRYAGDDPPRGGTLFVKHFLIHRDYERGDWKRS